MTVLKGLDPKNPRRALSGEGWADSTHGTSPSNGLSFCACRPHRTAAHGPPRHGDLSAWADQGVMLLNRTLTVRPGDSNSHQGKGWEPITERAITALAERGGPCAAILWGRHAQKLKPLLGEVPAVESAHPSPLSARRGFFGSRPFSTVNRLLEEQGAAPVDWTLPAYDDVPAR